MNQDWKQFLITHQASIHQDQVEAFLPMDEEITAYSQQPVMATLDKLALIEVSGEDAESFLQGQLSNDIRLVSEQQAQLSSYSTPKGRMLAIFRIFRFDDKYYLQTTAAIKDAIIKRLSMFVLMSKVRIADASDDLVCLGIHAQTLDSLGSFPQQTNQSMQQDGYCLIRLDDKRAQYIGKPAALMPIWESLLAKGCQPVAYNTWHISDIQQGIPAIYPESSDMFIPQMLNLDILDGINFKKGCYTGQEVIARLHYLGKQKRKMYLARVNSEQAPKPGDKVFAEQESSPQGTGNIVDSAQLAQKEYSVLVMMQIDALQKRVHLHDVAGPVLSIEALPYQV